MWRDFCCSVYKQTNMATIVFFEKTGCINNTKQKKILDLAGHYVQAVNLLKHPWTENELLSFFDQLEVKDWFNRNAPAITAGDVVPEDFDRESAIKALLKEPILIRRPLMVIGENRLVGFNPEELDHLIGIKAVKHEEAQNLLSQNLSVCPQKDRGLSCN
ncbi:nitrogenase-associated protein [Mangrovibacterium diazotrophicum]|uniref:Nitrogenase-associated protein n=2 Tax=Mangrovibacterium diazotrophicum TaxID=1261403 RepID=A0A419W2I5_9BACT|nr:nitrogenase-associated protein [Mangrovibacterium diazotrophicum]